VEAAAMHEAVSRRLFEAAVAMLTSDICESRGWHIATAAYPILAVDFAAPGRVTLRVCLTCDSWDALPPSITFHSTEGTLLATLPTGPGSQFNNSAHPSVGRPFLCMAGSREYHTHTSHLNDPWDNYKEKAAYELGGILTQVWRAWQGARP
jgi:Predicted metal binding domain